MLDCYIVKDLLPNYIENLTSVETNEKIAYHLEHCTDCKELYEKLKVSVPVLSNDENTDELDFFKKIKGENRKANLRNVGIIVAFFAFIFLLFVVGMPVNSDEISIETKIIENYEDVSDIGLAGDSAGAFDGKAVLSFSAKFLDENNASMHMTSKDVYSDELDENGNKVVAGCIITLRKRLSINEQVTGRGVEYLLSDLEGQTMILRLGNEDIVLYPID